MKGFFKKISAVGLSFFMLSACSAWENENVTTIVTSESAVATETETTTETITTAETTTADTVSEITTETFAASSELDRSFEFNENFMSEEDKYINRPMFLGEPENTGAEVYVKFTGDDIEDNYVIIKHDGVCTEFQTPWMGRWCQPPQLFSGDYDGDGENEIAAVRYSAGGTMCRIHDLTVFDKTDGGYSCAEYDLSDFIMEKLTWEIKNDTSEIIFSLDGTELVYDTSEHFTQNITGVWLGDVIDFTVIGDDITAEYGVFVETEGNFIPDYYFNIAVDIELDDGLYVMSEPRLTDVE